MPETTIEDHYDTIIAGGEPATRIFNKYLHIPDHRTRTLVIRVEERIVSHCGTPYIVWASEPLMQTPARSGSFLAGRTLEASA